MPTAQYTDERIQKLQAIQNRPTAYELVLYCADQRFLIAYCVRRTRSVILQALRINGDRIATLTCPTGNEMLVWCKRAQDGLTIGSWKASFSGRTQREAITTGELPRIGAN